MGTDVSTWAARHRGITGFIVGVVATLVVAGGGVAIAAIPSTSTSSFTGCVSKDTGVLRVIDYQAGKRCRKSEQRISWSKGWTHRGDWNGATTYRPGDVVSQGGSGWVAKKRTVGQAPNATPTAWGLLSRPGATGSTGPAGPVTLRYVYSANSTVAAGAHASVTVICPIGLYAVNGGVDTKLPAPEKFVINESSPEAADGTIPTALDRWSVSVTNGSGGAVDYRGFAVCSSATSVG